MSIVWAGYAVLVGLLLGAAAHGAERALRAAGRPGRWPWAAAMVGSWALALTALVRPTPAGPSLAEFRAVAIAGTPGATDAAEPGAIAALVEAAMALPGAVLGGARARSLELSDAVTTWGERNAAALEATGEGLLLVWGVTSILALLLVGLSVARLLRRSRAWPEARVLDEPVRLSPDFGPALLGFVRPRIVLPRWALGLGGRSLRLIVEHEREHRRARDTVLLAAGAAAALAAPWNPALWWQLRRLRLAVELDCDRRVLGRGAPAREYGALLVTVGERAGRVGLPAAALAHEPVTFLERRLRMITETRAKGWGWRTGGGIVLACALVVVACETPAPTGVNEAAVPPPAEATSPEGEGSTLSEAAGEATFRAVETDRRGTLRAIPDGALIVVDGVITDLATLDDLPEGRAVGSVEVVKGAVAERLFGERARHGLIRVTTTEGTGAGSTFESKEVEPSGRTPQDRTVAIDGPPRAPGSPLVVVDGVITDRALGDINAMDVQSIEIVKGEAARALYGERGRDGVVHVTTKDASAPTGGVLRRRDAEPAGPGGTYGLVELAPIVYVDGERWTGSLQEARALSAESIEVLKGAAAEVFLHGTGVDRDGRDVIRITTKR